MAAPNRKPIEWKLGRAAFAVYETALRAQNDGATQPLCRLAEKARDRSTSDEISRYRKGERIPTDASVIAAMAAISPVSGGILDLLLPTISARTPEAMLGKLYALALERIGAKPREIARVQMCEMAFHPHGYRSMRKPDPIARIAANTLELGRHRRSLAHFRINQSWYLAESIVAAAVEIPEFAAVAIELYDSVMRDVGPTLEDALGFGGEFEDVHREPDEREHHINRAKRSFEYELLRGCVASILHRYVVPPTAFLPVRYELERLLERLRDARGHVREIA